MYGIVNKAIEELVVSLGGQQKWEEVCREAGVDVFTFIAQERYDDDVTYKLVAASSKVFGICPHTVLLKFGAHWSKYTGQQGYGYLFKMLGDDFLTFLANLPALHDHIALIFPEMIMPRFESERLGPLEIKVLYRSSRPGLASMVHGLLEGMAEVYEKDSTFDADEFLVTLVAQ
ncbi:MAG: heme NO-binding protein [Proteobacteria bacterium]|nr:heme NO-binding protein [Pseudomonadota bacterium]